MKKNLLSLLTKYTAVCAFVSTTLITGCKKDNNVSAKENAPGPDINFYALTQDNRLLYLNAQNASMVNTTTAITGLQTGETLLGIDFRPATGELYGVGSTNRIYVINKMTGAARPVSSTP